ncbi:hypothetical protein Nepgr_006255 [Nepenthes gracilis]|uniref:endo-polygalacturonase n=1 Tax=Nepenthes gracilis TaxID=150966 RepID=A0AAD3S521_NEPGR|nr:hypothetical protein Nepgr_006255 [Nepenthes gracilis]
MRFKKPNMALEWCPRDTWKSYTDDVTSSQTSKSKTLFGMSKIGLIQTKLKSERNGQLRSHPIPGGLFPNAPPRQVFPQRGDTCLSGFPRPSPYRTQQSDEAECFGDCHGVAAPPLAQPYVVNVDHFIVRSNGFYDHSKAFLEAWKVACSCENGVLVVPWNKKYRLKPIKFLGPCNSDTTVKIYGKIEASEDPLDYQQDRTHWLRFENVQNLKVEGGGSIDGNGEVWWRNSCKVNKSRAVVFSECKNLRVDELRIANAQQMHLTFQECVDVVASNLMITAPERSPNTDGIHITGTKNIQIVSSVIQTGDDCISIVSGSTNVRATGITCGPGHGISIGSLGEGNSVAHVSNVIVNRAKFTGTENGVRIKTWQGGSGQAKDIVFQNIEMHRVNNPIIVDQYYCDRDTPCPEQKSAVKVSNVRYQNIKGTSSTKMAIKFDCSQSFPCQEIVLQNVNLAHEGGGAAAADCQHVKLMDKGHVSPSCS